MRVHEDPLLICLQNEFVESEEEILRRKKIQRYLVTSKAYGGSGVRDDHLRLCNVEINVGSNLPIFVLS